MNKKSHEDQGSQQVNKSMAQCQTYQNMAVHLNWTTIESIIKISSQDTEGISGESVGKTAERASDL